MNKKYIFLGILICFLISITAVSASDGLFSSLGNDNDVTLGSIKEYSFNFTNIENHTTYAAGSAFTIDPETGKFGEQVSGPAPEVELYGDLEGVITIDVSKSNNADKAKEIIDKALFNPVDCNLEFDDGNCLHLTGYGVEGVLDGDIFKITINTSEILEKDINGAKLTGFNLTVEDENGAESEFSAEV